MSYIFILIGIILRLLPHPANFAPISAMALFGGTKLDKRFALVFPLVAMIVSDLFLGFHGTMFWVYGSFVATGLIGLWLRSHYNAKNVILAALSSSVIFFLITNFGVWANGWYGHTFEGLVRCYVMAIPFFKMTLAGDLVYSVAFFGGYELISRAVAAKRDLLLAK